MPKKKTLKQHGKELKNMIKKKPKSSTTGRIKTGKVKKVS